MENQSDLKNKEVLIIIIIIKIMISKNLPNLCTAFVKGFGIKEGAFASSVAHDSHNVIVIGTDNQIHVSGSEYINRK